MKYVFIVSVAVFALGLASFMIAAKNSKKLPDQNSHEFSLNLKKSSDETFSCLIGTYNYGPGASGFGLDAEKLNSIFRDDFKRWVMVPVYIDEFWDDSSETNPITIFENKLNINKIPFSRKSDKTIPIIPSGVDKLEPLRLVLKTHYAKICFYDSTPTDIDLQNTLNNYGDNLQNNSFFTPPNSIFEYEGHGGPLKFKDPKYVRIALSSLFQGLDDYSSILGIDLSNHKARYIVTKLSGNLHIVQNDFDNRKRVIVDLVEGNNTPIVKKSTISYVEKTVWYMSNRMQAWSIILMAGAVLLGVASVLIAGLLKFVGFIRSTR